MNSESTAIVSLGLPDCDRALTCRAIDHSLGRHEAVRRRLTVDHPQLAFDRAAMLDNDIARQPLACCHDDGWSRRVSGEDESRLVQLDSVRPCDQVLEVFDGSTYVAIRLTVRPEKLFE